MGYAVGGVCGRYASLRAARACPTAIARPTAASVVAPTGVRRRRSCELWDRRRGRRGERAATPAADRVAGRRPAEHAPGRPRRDGPPRHGAHDHRRLRPGRLPVERPSGHHRAARPPPAALRVSAGCRTDDERHASSAARARRRSGTGARRAGVARRSPAVGAVDADRRRRAAHPGAVHQVRAAAPGQGRRDRAARRRRRGGPRRALPRRPRRARPDRAGDRR